MSPTQRTKRQVYERENPHRRYYNYRKSARARGIFFDLSKDEFFTIINDACSYCGSVGLNGIDRIDNGIGYMAGNVQTCCWLCNRAKNDLPKDHFIEHCKKIADHCSKN